MNRNHFLPSTATSNRFRLPLWVLLLCCGLLCSKAWSGPRYQDLDFNDLTKCPTPNSGNIASYAASNTQANQCPGGCDIAPANAPANVTWQFNNDAADGGCEAVALGSNPPTVTCAGVTVTLPPLSPNSVSGTTAAQVTAKSQLPPGASSYFFLTVTESPDGTPACQRWYHFHTTSSGGGWGDIHAITVDDVHYDFQSTGEFTALKRGKEFVLQTRDTPVPSAPAVSVGDYTGLTSCVAIYTGVATRVGRHKVSYQSNQQTLSGDASEMQLFIDDRLTKLPPDGIDLYAGDDEVTPMVERRIAGRIVSTGGDGIEIDYADGTAVVVTPQLWQAQMKWYLTVNVYGTTATEGILGLTKDGWLPALPDGTSLGPRPSALHDRYVQLYETFADAWRVRDETSLFHYPQGTSTQTFTNRAWPGDNPSSCGVPGAPKPQPPIDVHAAEKYCSAVVDKNDKANCIFDVSVTGETSFARHYEIAEHLNPALTKTSVKGNADPTKYGETVSFTATVAPTRPSGSDTPGGTVQFILDGSNVGNPIPLDSKGQAVWNTSSLSLGTHLVKGNYIPSGWATKLFLASSSPDESHTVLSPSSFYWWLIILLIVILLIAFLVWKYLRTI